MKRIGLFFIGLISAIITIVSLNIAFGSPEHYGHLSYHEHGYSCDRKHHNDTGRSTQDHVPYSDSATSKY